jgi:hypothetical protein
MAMARTPKDGEPSALDKLTRAPWREHALARIEEQRFILSCLREASGAWGIPPAAERAINAHWQAASSAAEGRARRGPRVARAIGHLDAVDTDLLRIGPSSYVYGQLPGLLTRARKLLPADDDRRRRLEQFADLSGCAELSDCDRDLIVAAHHATTSEARREVTRLRDFNRVLLVTAAVLSVGALAFAAFAFVAPDKVPLCFSPSGNIVCATTTTAIDGTPSTAPGQPSALAPATIDAAMRRVASGWDIALVMAVGLLAAALAAATSLRGIRGTSTPFSLPVALALLKLPTGALTAVLGLVLMRGEFIPGLSALDSSAQIISWAVVLGYSQQLLTRFVDQRAQTVLENFGRTADERERAHTSIQPTPVPVHS